MYPPVASLRPGQCYTPYMDQLANPSVCSLQSDTCVCSLGMSPVFHIQLFELPLLSFLPTFQIHRVLLPVLLLERSLRLVSLLCLHSACWRFPWEPNGKRIGRKNKAMKIPSMPLGFLVPLVREKVFPSSC